MPSPARVSYSRAAAVRRLRIALRGEGGSPSMVETVGSRGYRLSVRVEWLPDPDEKEPPRQPRLAVMPFADLNARPGDFFRDGSKGIAVIAPGTSGRLKANGQTHPRAAQQLHADFELSGTVSRMNGWVRITSRLVRLRDQNCIWTQSLPAPGPGFLRGAGRDRQKDRTGDRADDRPQTWGLCRPGERAGTCGLRVNE